MHFMFQEHKSVLVATEWSDTEISIQVQVSWGCIREGQKA